jgi:peptidoglycan/xylan/chitin deacetylase (PgdA/CDA1 family)
VVEEDRTSVRRDILRGASALHAVSGRRTRWLRPPRGMVDGDVLAGATAAGSELVLWSVTRGGPAVRGSAGVLSHLVSHLHPGAIIDLHDGTGTHSTDQRLLRRRHEELAILPAFLARSIAAGYRFVTVSELLDPLLDPPAGTGPQGSGPAVPAGGRPTVAGD